MNPNANNDISIKFAHMEGKVERIEAIVERIEKAVSGVLSLDRTIAEVALQQKHMAEKLADVRQDVAECNATHKAGLDQVAVKLALVSDKHNELENKSAGALRVMGWISGIIVTVMLSCGAWVFNRATENARLLSVQQVQIERLQKEVAEQRPK